MPAALPQAAGMDNTPDPQRHGRRRTVAATALAALVALGAGCYPSPFPGGGGGGGGGSTTSSTSSSTSSTSSTTSTTLVPLRIFNEADPGPFGNGNIAFAESTGALPVEIHGTASDTGDVDFFTFTVDGTKVIHATCTGVASVAVQDDDDPNTQRVGICGDEVTTEVTGNGSIRMNPINDTAGPYVIRVTFTDP